MPVDSILGVAAYDLLYLTPSSLLAWEKIISDKRRDHLDWNMIIYENALYQQTEAIKQNNQILSYLIKLRVKILKYNVFLGTLYSKENALIIFVSCFLTAEFVFASISFTHRAGCSINVRGHIWIVSSVKKRHSD